MFSGQTIVAISQIFILGIPPQLAATWFPSSQVSSACAIGVFGNQVLHQVLNYRDFFCNSHNAILANVIFQRNSNHVS